MPRRKAKFHPSLAPLAQLAEQLTLNQRVVGSSPTWRNQFIYNKLQPEIKSEIFAMNSVGDTLVTH
jgi:hypothetical protein